MKILQAVPKPGAPAKLKTLLKATERGLRGPHTTFRRAREGRWRHVKYPGWVHWDGAPGNLLVSEVHTRAPDHEWQILHAFIGYLDRQLALVRPKVVCALGSHAAKNLLGVTTSVGKLRGQVHDAHGTQVVVTYHPAYLLRSPGEKPKAWEDLKFVLKLLGKPVPAHP